MFDTLLEIQTPAIMDMDGRAATYDGVDVTLIVGDVGYMRDEEKYGENDIAKMGVRVQLAEIPSAAIDDEIIIDGVSWAVESIGGTKGGLQELKLMRFVSGTRSNGSNEF